MDKIHEDYRCSERATTEAWPAGGKPGLRFLRFSAKTWRWKPCKANGFSGRFTRRSIKVNTCDLAELASR